MSVSLSATHTGELRVQMWCICVLSAAQKGCVTAHGGQYMSCNSKH